MIKFLLSVCFLLVFSTSYAQDFEDIDGFNPVFDIETPESENQNPEQKGLIAIKMKPILSSSSNYAALWRDEIEDRKGHFFLLEAEYKLPNDYKIVFSQLKSNLTCANYGEYNEVFQGNENCYTKLIMISPKYHRTIEIENIWMDGYNDTIYIKPDTGKNYFDIKINDKWYKYAPSQKKYIYEGNSSPSLNQYYPLGYNPITLSEIPNNQEMQKVWQDIILLLSPEEKNNLTFYRYKSGNSIITSVYSPMICGMQTCPLRIFYNNFGKQEILLNTMTFFNPNYPIFAISNNQVKNHLNLFISAPDAKFIWVFNKENNKYKLEN